MYFNTTVRQRLSTITVLLATAVSVTLNGAGSILNADGDFENGNAVVKEVDADAGRIVITNTPVRGSQNIWWHVRLTGVTPGQEIELVVDNDNRRAGGANPVYSYDRKTWNRLERARSPFTYTFTESTVWIACNIPYTYSDSLALAESLKDEDRVDVLDLCTSEGGRDVKLLRITDPETPADDKKVIWILARQHAFESHSSRVAEGFARWSCEDAATELLQQAIVFIVPIMDVDSVYEGGAGKDKQPVDFNRSWEMDSPWAAVRASISMLDELVGSGKHELAAFIDLHSPYYYQSSHWYLPGTETQETNLRKFAALYSKTLEEMDAANRWAPNARFNRFRDTTGRSRDYVRKNLIENSPNILLTTMEIGHWRDGTRAGQGEFITAEGLDDYGRGLGKAFTQWFAAIHSTKTE